MPTAHFVPSSLLMEEIAAIHGVYRRQNTRRDAADSGESTSNNVFVLPNNTESVETTLSFAINHANKDVQIRQSPKPSGAKYVPVSISAKDTPAPNQINPFEKTEVLFSFILRTLLRSQMHGS